MWIDQLNWSWIDLATVYTCLLIDINNANTRTLHDVPGQTIGISISNMYLVGCPVLPEAGIARRDARGFRVHTLFDYVYIYTRTRT